MQGQSLLFSLKAIPYNPFRKKAKGILSSTATCHSSQLLSSLEKLRELTRRCSWRPKSWQRENVGCNNVQVIHIYIYTYTQDISSCWFQGFNPNEILGQNEDHFQVGYRRCSKPPPRYEKTSDVRDTLMYLYVIFSWPDTIFEKPAC